MSVYVILKIVLNNPINDVVISYWRKYTHASNQALLWDAIGHADAMVSSSITGSYKVHMVLLH